MATKRLVTLLEPVMIVVMGSWRGRRASGRGHRAHLPVLWHHRRVERRDLNSINPERGGPPWHFCLPLYIWEREPAAARGSTICRRYIGSRTTGSGRVVAAAQTELPEGCLINGVITNEAGPDRRASKDFSPPTSCR